MTNQLEVALKAVRDVLRSEAHPHCVGVNVFFNSNGYKLEYRMRTPGSLERDGISMRNIRGEWVEK